ncbi:MAG: CDP-alcohol phosphatidyltransferase family protein, partial [Deltaproteobacteria bacterium]|nr:CDP-alcohol phosphatidyltransferase family protein [Deltaproteobacteria bacterium]
CSLLFGMFSAASLFLGHFGFGAVFATISAFLDSLDGLVARLTGCASDAGEVLDAAIDRYVEFFFLGALVLYYRDMVGLQLLAIAVLLGSFMVSYSTAKAEALGIKIASGMMRRPERAFYLIVGAALSPISIRFLEAFNPIPIGYPMVAALLFVGLLSNITAIERFWTIAKRVRTRNGVLDHSSSNEPAIEREAENNQWTITNTDPIQIG